MGFILLKAVEVNFIEYRLMLHKVFAMFAKNIRSYKTGVFKNADVELNVCIKCKRRKRGQRLQNTSS